VEGVRELLKQAEAFRKKTSDPEQQAFWSGYIRGLRRAVYGSRFDSEEEHAVFMELAEGGPDPIRQQVGRGYRAGLEGTPPVECIS
jgi:hypothetical protein